MKKRILFAGISACITALFLMTGCPHHSSSGGWYLPGGGGNNNPSTGGDTPGAAQQHPTQGQVTNADVKIIMSEGLQNSAYVVFQQFGSSEYTVLCDDNPVDEQLIRYYDKYTYYYPTENDGQTTWTENNLTKVVRVDALGLKKGSHTIKVGVKDSGKYSSAKINVIEHDRSGFAFAPSAATTPGAYNKDGTLKDKAIVLYVTAGTAKTVSYTAVKGTNATENNTFTGLQDVLSEKSLKNLTVPLDIRIIGTIRLEDLDRFDSSDQGLQIKTTTTNGVTVEGVGHDAAVYGFGFLIREAHYVELSNLGVYNFMDDGISVDTNNDYLWIHNNDISYGTVGSDGDQAKGDGSLDFKKSYYSTLSYNHFWDSGKCNLLDAQPGSGTSASNYLSYHHNWYDHSDSRHPRIRNASAVHVYNNYYDGNSKYGIGVTSGSSCFAEGNYFRDAKDPMMSAGQGTDARGSGTFSGEEGGVIKAWNNKFTENNKYNQFQYISNKKDWTNNIELGKYEEHTTELGDPYPGGGYLIYSWTYGEDFPSFIVSSADNKSGYYQIGKGKSGFTLTVPANASKVVINAKSSGSNVNLSVDSVSKTITNADYSNHEFDISGLSKTTLVVSAGSDASINVKSIKVIAATTWKTTYSTGADLTDIDAYEVDSRNDKVPAAVKTKLGGHTYSNFDTELGNTGMGLTNNPSSPDDAKSDVISLAGRHNPDFAWTFNNAVEDKNDKVIAELKSAIVGYKSGLTKTQGTGSSGTGGGSGTTTPGGDSGNTGGNTGGGDSGNTGGNTGGGSGNPPAPPPAGAVASLTFDKDDSLHPVPAGIDFTLANDTAVVGSKDFYPSTGKVKILKMESNTTVAFTTPGATTDSYTMTINYVTTKAATLELTPTGGTKETISLPIGGSLGSNSDKTGSVVSVATTLKGGTAYTIGKRSAEHYIYSIVITE